MLITTLFTIGKRWKQSNCPLADEEINIMWYIHTAEYYSTIKRNEIVIYLTILMDLEKYKPDTGHILHNSTYMMYLE